MKYLIIITSFIASTSSLFGMNPKPSLAIFNNDKNLTLSIKNGEHITNGIKEGSSFFINSKNTLRFFPRAHSCSLDKNKTKNAFIMQLSIYNNRTRKQQSCNLHVGGDDSVINFGDKIRINRNKRKNEISIIQNKTTMLESLSPTDLHAEIGLKKNDITFIPYKKRKLLS